MHIRYGYTIDFACDAPTPIVTMLDIHPMRRHDITQPDDMHATALDDGQTVDVSAISLDRYQNVRRRIMAPAGGLTLQAMGVLHDSGFPDEQVPHADAQAPHELDQTLLQFVQGSRYCETDRLATLAWSLFGGVKGGWNRVQAVCDYVHERIRFNYHAARATRTAFEAHEERVGVCRDYAHLAIAMCRALNIPARYVTGYLGDIGVAPDPSPMDFSAWFEAYLEGRWWAFDARHNTPRIGRITIGIGLDANDVPILHSFGTHKLTRFEVITAEVEGARFPISARQRRAHWGTDDADEAGTARHIAA
jgi:transglutaminase-like putative cysteine protease